MSAQESIIFKSQNVNMTFTQYSAIVRQIIPHNITIRREQLVPHGKGFIIDLAELKSANFIYGPSFIEELNAHNLTAELTFQTTNNRLVFLTNVPDDIHSKEPNELKEEIEKATEKRIYKVHKFTGQCNYITATADNRLSRDSIVREGHIKLFGQHIQTEFPKPKGRSNPSMRSQSEHGRDQTYLARMTHNHRNHEITNPPPPRENAWFRNRPHFPTQHNASVQRFNDSYPPLSETITPRNHQNGNVRHPDFKNEFELDFFTKMSDKICRALQEGLENPEDYLNSMNNINEIYGIPKVPVPKEDLVLARNKFLCKSNTTNNSMNNDTNPSNSMTNNTHPTNSQSMETDTVPLNPTEPTVSTILPNATDPSIPPTDLPIPSSMPIATEPSTNTSMTNENNPQNSPSMSNDTNPTNLSSMPNDPESSVPPSMINTTDHSVPPAPPASSPPKNATSTSVTSPRRLRKLNQNQQNKTKSNVKSANKN